MYFYIDCLQKKGKFGLLWIAAFECTDFNKRSIQTMVKRWDIQKSCDDILKYTVEGRENSPKMNLYVTSNLLAGAVKILKQKAVFILRDSAHLFIKWGEIARLIMLRDVRTRRFGQEDDPAGLAASKSSLYLHQHHHSETPAELFERDSAKKQKKKQRISQALPEARSLDAYELVERLRIADGDLAEGYLVPQDVTMREVPPIREDQSFGAVGIEDLAPEVQEALGEVRPGVLQPSELDVPIAPEVMGDIPVPALDADVPVATIQPEPQLPTIEVQQPRDTSEVDIEKVLEEMLAAEVSITEREEAVIREEPQRKARDSNLEFSIDKIKERCTNYQKLMRILDPRKDTLKIKEKRTATPDWIIPDELKIAAHLLPPFAWPSARPKHPIKLAILQQRISQVQGVEDESMQVQQMRDGGLVEDASMHMRSYIGSPTPTAPPREGRVRATPSPSPIGKGVQRISAELNIGDILEPIAETAVIDASALLHMSIEQVPEPQAPAAEKEQEILAGEIGPSPPKRPRTDEDSEPQSSSEQPTLILERNEDKMKSLIAGVFARKETVTFRDIAPPSTTKKRTAARLFSTLLDLEKRKVLVTQQEEAYGTINIHLVQPAT